MRIRTHFKESHHAPGEEEHAPEQVRPARLRRHLERGAPAAGRGGQQLALHVRDRLAARPPGGPQPGGPELVRRAHHAAVPGQGRAHHGDGGRVVRGRDEPGALAGGVQHAAVILIMNIEFNAVTEIAHLPQRSSVGHGFKPHRERTAEQERRFSRSSAGRATDC